MMIEPPIDELTAKMGGNKYKLCCVMEKRAKELEKTIPDEIIASDKKAISMKLWLEKLYLATISNILFIL